MATTTKPSRKGSAAQRAKHKAGSRVEKISDLVGTPRFWRSSAPKGVDGPDAWSIWSRHLGKRRAPRDLAKLCSASASPLSWGVRLAELSPRTVELLALVEQLDRKQLGRKPAQGKSRVTHEMTEQILAGWLEGSRALPQSVDFALECLAIATALTRITDVVLPEFWWSLLDALWEIAHSACDWRADAELPPEQGLAQQMLAGELPLTLAYLLPEMRPLNKLRAAAHEALSEGLAELTNGNGLVRGAYLGSQRPLLACWTRCRAMGDQLKKGCWSRKSNEQYEWAITHALGLSTAAGTPLLGQPHDDSWSADFLREALNLGGDLADASAARSILGKRLAAKIAATGKSKPADQLPETSDNCEWSGVAYLRGSWKAKAPLLAIDYSSPDLRLECWNGSRRLLRGTWTWETTLDEARLEPIGCWDESCWFSDEDVDYLELSMELTDGARLERQILLAREEQFLLLSDYVFAPHGGQLSHRYRLPLEFDVEFVGEQDTREGRLDAGKTVARVLPLALPEWRSDPRVGKLTASNGRLQLEQQREGQNMACPLLIDLNKSRAKKPCTWRQLTVAQSLEVQSHDIAVGYRAQCGKDQWLIYRSLAEPANRTLLGQNLSNECLVAKFLAPSGEIDELLEIE